MTMPMAAKRRPSRSGREAPARASRNGGGSTIERRLRRQVSVQVKQDDHADGCEAQAVHLRDKPARTGFAGNMSQESAGNRIASGNRERGRAFLEASRIGLTCIHIQNSALKSRSNILTD